MKNVFWLIVIIVQNKLVCSNICYDKSNVVLIAEPLIERFGPELYLLNEHTLCENLSQWKVWAAGDCKNGTYDIFSLTNVQSPPYMVPSRCAKCWRNNERQVPEEVMHIFHMLQIIVELTNFVRKSLLLILRCQPLSFIIQKLIIIEILKQ